MLIREGDQRDLAVDIRLATLLAGIAGALNAAGFQAVGLFSANMTGNLSAFSDHLSLGELGAAALFGALLVVFIAGACTSGLLIEAGRKRQIRAIYAFSIVLEGLLLLLLGGVDIFIPAFDSSALLVLGLSFVMGLQNAATTRISNARVRTTHVSGMATDIGLGLAALFDRAPQRESALARLRLYTSTIIAFLIGGIVGVALYLTIGGYLLVFAAAILFAIALPEVKRAGTS
ncbi:YoaK family protein [Devosia sp. RR2S18]|uniref:YoaK family protein n=1 Tax=Devosia rhizosphaerae TaxID=3049774 RepID=UPI002541C077|nr:YoaK family protein [Devosia sp. RR2S18]WIJ26994.1 YoaK family protein [Devosia sp. RR2S18]